MQKVETLQELESAMNNRRAVVIPGTVWEKPKPAAVIIQLPGTALVKLFKKGIYLYERREKLCQKKWGYRSVKTG